MRRTHTLGCEIWPCCESQRISVTTCFTDPIFSGFSRLAFYVALRSLCGGSEEKLFLQEPDDPLTKEIDLTDTSPAFTERYLASFREPLPKDESTVQLCDRSETGWLAWGRQMEVSRLSGWEEDTWVVDPTSKDGIEVFRKIISAEGWWQRVSFIWPSGLAMGRANRHCSMRIIGLAKSREITPPEHTLISSSV